ncbi:hypothetical protein ABZ403_08205 [Micromonospora zamorensis]|uniref:hypothetical protein n=1 Tax=Micromonospora zamorensis TaxID=709883 RepID=UPI003406EEBC
MDAYRRFAQELIRSAVATNGLIAAVPVTTALAACLAARHGTTAADPPQQHIAVAITTGTPPSAGAEPVPADPWMAFVDRHPDTRP